MFQEIRDPDKRVRAVCEYGMQVSVDPAIPVKRYFRSGKEMIRMANIYLEEKDFESAFILYSKFVVLFVEKLPKHPDYKSANPSEVSLNKKKLKEVFPIAELLKGKLKTKFQEEEAIRKKEEEHLRKEEEARLEKERAAAAAEAERKAAEEARQAEEREERRKLEQEQELRKLKGAEEARLRHLQAEQNERDAQEAAAALAAATAAQHALSRVSIDNGALPPPAYGAVDTTPAVPDRNRKPIPSAPPSTVPSVDRSNKPDHFTSVGAVSNNPYGLKTVVVPANLMRRFLELAAANTAQTIETFGALCGKLVPSRNAFVLSHLVIPKQRGTPDSCEPYNEEEIFDVQDKYGLNFIGWIHTHPTQTAFLSSVDCHTQCSYQMLLPEMIAIVCSPKFQETGYFHLSPDHGLQVVANCTQAGFHKHQDNPPLFQPCGHVQLDPAAPVTVVDLRGKT